MNYLINESGAKDDLITACFPLRQWPPSPNFVADDKFGGNYQRIVIQSSLPEISKVMNIKNFWCSLLKFIAQASELSFRSEKM